MKLYNTSSRKIENLKPLNSGTISLYTCGPTVYDKPTIGNWASFIRYDILARAIRADGYKLNWIMNITDVGHLTSDADEGEDKLEKGAKRESKTAWEIADYYSDYFFKGLEYFNISVGSTDIIRATEKIDQQIDLVKRLEAKGHTYETADGIYFDSTTFADYGKMALLDVAGLKQGFRVKPGGKKHVTDFALWKFSPKDKKRDMEWDSPWGKGFPGWHLECSAIILDSLGEHIDIHAGGIEHIPIHHTNEIAQSESVTGKPLASIWVHNNHLKVNGEKISKSLNNGYIMEDLQKKGFKAEDFRMFVLQSNYRNETNFTWEALEEAKQKRLQMQALADLRFQTKVDTNDDANPDTFLNMIKDALMDNLNTAGVSPVISQLSNKLSQGLVYDTDKFNSFLASIDDILGFRLLDSKDISNDQKILIATRNEARLKGDWEKADDIRDKLLSQNISLKDIDGSSIWSKIY